MNEKHHQCDSECNHGATGYEQTIDEIKFESKFPLHSYQSYILIRKI